MHATLTAIRDETKLTYDVGVKIKSLPAVFGLTASSGAAPNIQSSVHGTIFKGTPHLDEKLHRFVAGFAM